MEQFVRRAGEEVLRQRTAGDRRQFADVHLVVVDDGDDHPNAADAADGRLDGRQLWPHVRVAVADEHGDVGDAVAVAVVRLSLIHI